MVQEETVWLLYYLVDRSSGPIKSPRKVNIGVIGRQRPKTNRLTFQNQKQKLKFFPNMTTINNYISIERFDEKQLAKSSYSNIFFKMSIHILCTYKHLEDQSKQI